MTDVQEILEIITGVVIALFVLFLLVILVWDVLAKEHPHRIHVVRKRESLHKCVRRSTGQEDTYTHYTIDCTFPDSDKLHTFDCEASVFYQMEKGKSYTVMLKRMTIHSIVKKHKRK